MPTHNAFAMKTTLKQKCLADELKEILKLAGARYKEWYG
jgi:thermostable 8-oxoguanine DNA glycosylase